MKCMYCINEVEEERVEMLNSRVCSRCAKKAPPQPSLDPNIVCAEASKSGSNGFSPKD